MPSWPQRDVLSTRRCGRLPACICTHMRQLNKTQMFLYCLPVCLLGRTVYVVLSVLKSVVLYFVLSVVLSVSLSVVLVVLLLCCLIRCWWLPKCSLLCACKQANNFPRCHGASFAMMIPKPRLIHAHMCAEAKQRLSNLQFPSLPRAKHRFS